MGSTEEQSGRLLLVVAVALIAADGRILLQRRPAGRPMAGLWEFPGGKVECGESPNLALCRELAEELGIGVDLDDLIPLTFAAETLGDKDLLLLLYVCQHWRGEPAALHADELCWATLDEMQQLPMPPADLPFVGALRAFKTPEQRFPS
jgi:8-oxo-dGTP diphosphatase